VIEILGDKFLDLIVEHLAVLAHIDDISQLVSIFEV